MISPQLKRDDSSLSPPISSSLGASNADDALDDFVIVLKPSHFRNATPTFARKQNGWTAKDYRYLDYPLNKLRSSSLFSTKELSEAFTVKELLDDGCDINSLLGAGFTIRDLYCNGVSLKAIQEKHGNKCIDFVKAGFTNIWWLKLWHGLKFSDDEIQEAENWLASQKK